MHTFSNLSTLKPLSVITRKGSLLLKICVVEFLYVVSQYFSREARHEF